MARLLPHARVDDAVENVRGQIASEHERSRCNGNAGKQRGIAAKTGRDGRLAEPRIGKHLLHQGPNRRIFRKWTQTAASKRRKRQVAQPVTAKRRPTWSGRAHGRTACSRLSKHVDRSSRACAARCWPRPPRITRAREAPGGARRRPASRRPPPRRWERRSPSGNHPSHTENTIKDHKPKPERGRGGQHEAVALHHAVGPDAP